MSTSKKVKQLDYFTGELVEEYNSISDAAYDNWLNERTVYKALNKRNGFIHSLSLRFEFA